MGRDFLDYLPKLSALLAGDLLAEGRKLGPQSRDSLCGGPLLNPSLCRKNRRGMEGSNNDLRPGIVRVGFQNGLDLIRISERRGGRDKLALPLDVTSGEDGARAFVGLLGDGGDNGGINRGGGLRCGRVFHFLLSFFEAFASVSSFFCLRYLQLFFKVRGLRANILPFGSNPYGPFSDPFWAVPYEQLWW